MQLKIYLLSDKRGPIWNTCRIALPHSPHAPIRRDPASTDLLSYLVIYLAVYGWIDWAVLGLGLGWSLSSRDSACVHACPSWRSGRRPKHVWPPAAPLWSARHALTCLPRAHQTQSHTLVDRSRVSVRVWRWGLFLFLEICPKFSHSTKVVPGHGRNLGGKVNFR